MIMAGEYSYFSGHFDPAAKFGARPQAFPFPHHRSLKRGPIENSTATPPNHRRKIIPGPIIHGSVPQQRKWSPAPVSNPAQMLSSPFHIKFQGRPLFWLFACHYSFFYVGLRLLTFNCAIGIKFWQIYVVCDYPFCSGESCLKFYCYDIWLICCQVLESFSFKSILVLPIPFEMGTTFHLLQNMCINSIWIYQAILFTLQE